jgi:hypothetical protein
MMKRSSFFARFMLSLLLVALLAVSGMLLFRAGWSQGYQSGLLVDGGAQGESLPAFPYFGGLTWRPFVPGVVFPFSALCLGIGFIFLIMFLVGGLMKPWGRWHWAGNPHPGKWSYGPKPPWAEAWKKYHQDLHAEDEESGETSESGD